MYKLSGEIDELGTYADLARQDIIQCCSAEPLHIKRSRIPDRCEPLHIPKRGVVYSKAIHNFGKITKNRAL